MTPRSLCSDAAALLLATASLPAVAWAGAQSLYFRALRLLEGRRVSHIRAQRVRAEIHVLRTAEAIVADYAALWAPLYDPPRINHPNHTRV